MSGGIAYVYDVDGEFAKRCNPAMVDLEPLATEAEQRARLAREFWHKGQADETLVRAFIQNHAKYTGSKRAADILGNWNEARARFVKVFPKEYRRALAELARSPQKVA